jgi:hypothetical protein
VEQKRKQIADQIQSPQIYEKRLHVKSDTGQQANCETQSAEI